MTIDNVKYARSTESQVVKDGAGALHGVIVNSHTSGTLEFIDGLENSVAASGTLTQSVGATVPASHGQNVLTSTGAFVEGTHAVSVFTSSGVVVNAQTITIGTTVYTAKAQPSAEYDVAMGTNAAAFLVNLKNAINGIGAFVPSAHASVVAVSSDATTLTIRGRVPGTSLNTVATTETFTNGSWADTTLGGGTGASDAGVTTAAATVTIGAITYTFVDALSETYGATAVPYQVLKGASVATALDNLKLAINGNGTAGTTYGTGTVAHAYFRATTNTDTAQTIVSRTVGTAAEVAVINTLATTETLANTSWADTTYGGGTGNSNPVVTSDDATFTIGSITYTGVLELSEASGATAVPYQVLWVTSEAVFLDNIKSAINATGTAGTTYGTGTVAHPTVFATTNTDTTQLVVAKTLGTGGNSIATTETMANYAWGAATLGSGAGSNGSQILNTITFAAGPNFITFPQGISFNTGLSTVVGGTIDYTILYI